MSCEATKIHQSSRWYEIGYIQNERDANDCAALQGTAYIAMLGAIDAATGGEITRFVRESDFLERKFDYYKGFIGKPFDNRVAREIQSNGQLAIRGLCTVSRDPSRPSRAHLDSLFVNQQDTRGYVASRLLLSQMDMLPDCTLLTTQTTFGIGAVEFFKTRGFRDVFANLPMPREPFEWGSIILPQQIALEASRDDFYAGMNIAGGHRPLKGAADATTPRCLAAAA